MLRTCVGSLCRTGRGAISVPIFCEKSAKASQRLLRLSSTSSDGKSTFKAPLPGASTSFKSLSSDATVEENVLGETEQPIWEHSEKEIIQQYSEKSLNSVTLLGRVGVNPQLRGSDNHPVVAFSLATNIQYRPGGNDSGNELVKKTEWHNIVCFRPNLRESVYNYVAKGSRVMIQGRIMYGSVEDKQGNLRTTTSIVAEDVIRFA